MLVVDILGSEEIGSYSQGVAKFFTNAGQSLQSAGLKDPANNSNIIDSYLDNDSTRTKLLDLIKTEKEVAERAVKFEKEGGEDNAVKEWNKIFGKSGENKGDSYNFQPSGPTIIRNPSKPWAQ